MHYSFKQFQTEYPTDDACLDKIFLQRYGKKPTCPQCGVIHSKFHRISGRRAYVCQWCGFHLYPCAGTPFEKSTTPLTTWFHAIYLMTVSRNGISAKELQRFLGVTYKTAWRMGHKLRELMTENIDLKISLTNSTHIELDETFVGGKEKNKHANKRTKGTQGAGSIKTKSIVFAALGRNGNIYAEVVPDTRSNSLHPIINFEVLPGSKISTDELTSYRSLPALGFKHGVVQHGIGEYVKDEHHVNGVEGFWRHLKCGIIGTYVSVSPKYLQNYVDEFVFRYNYRKQSHQMFQEMLCGIPIPHLTQVKNSLKVNLEP